jgi:hypothetical protein
MLAQLEAELVARLQQALPAHVRVLTAEDLKDLTEERLPTPSVHLIYQGYQVKENRADGRVARISERWLAVIAVSASRRGNSGSDARDSAQALFDELVPALMGWQPVSAAAPILLATPPAPAFGSHCLYLPTAFDIETTITAIRS